jgi:hypothetical protein
MHRCKLGKTSGNVALLPDLRLLVREGAATARIGCAEERSASFAWRNCATDAVCTVSYELFKSLQGSKKHCYQNGSLIEYCHEDHHSQDSQEILGTASGCRTAR